MKNQSRNYAVKIFKNLANAKRIKILESIISNKGITVLEISKSTQISQGVTSTYLTQMRKDGLIAAKQDGLHMHYSIKDPNIQKLLKTIAT